MSTRILVVDDSSIFRRAVSEALSGVSDVEVIGTASDGKQALARVAALRPDLVTLDIEMPEMNGIEVLDAIRKSGAETTVIMVSCRTVRGGHLTVRALEAGAFDFITKPESGTPSENIEHLRRALRPMIHALQHRSEIRSILRPGAPVSVPPPHLAPPSRRIRTQAPIVLIGVSTGGPTALAQVLPALPSDLPAPVFIVQHMPPLFTEALAQRLQAQSALAVRQAQEGELARPGVVYLAPGGRHMKLQPGPNGAILIRITDDPPENNCRPSVDYLFRSAALHFPGRSVAAILTGMGNDGAAGMRMLKRGGCSTIAQDEASCVVFGMPREAILAGVVDTVVPLSRVAESIVRAVIEARL